MSTISNDGVWIRLSNGSIVKLDKDPALGDYSVDTDGDGVSDLVELGKEISVGYFDYNTHETVSYKYWTFESNPSCNDTDGDTLKDGSDKEPMIYNVCIKEATDNEITFNDGKIWNVFGIDIYKFSDQAWSFIDRTVTDPIVSNDEIGSYMNILAKNKKIKFNNEQLAMIYLYDANGLRGYLNSKSQSKISKIFKLITGRSPKYYRHTIGDEWKEVSNPSEKKWYDVFTPVYCETEGTLTICGKTDFVDFLYKSLPTLISAASIAYSGILLIPEIDKILTGINIMGLRKTYETYKYCGSQGLSVAISSINKSKQDVINEAVAFQSGVLYPYADTWKTTTLKKGDIVYGGFPGPSNFYTAESTMKNCGTDAQKIFESLQVSTNDAFPNYREYMVKYEVQEDIIVATSKVEANTQWGAGGSIQYYVRDYESVLKAVDKYELTNITPKPEYQYNVVKKILGIK